MSSRYYHAKECYFIAIAIKVLLQDTDWLRYAGLWLTTLDNDFDDRLWIDEENNLFLNRRYEYDLSTEALRRSLQQQCTIAKHLQLNYDARSDDYHDTKHGTEHYIDEPRIFR
ncbi:hypothetical protein CIG19_14800 [Enterobacterales bacterium CwR94]|nr:hypothetical protein CIG19_14800 [Enterobacterales bacterium CwR94]